MEVNYDFKCEKNCVTDGELCCAPSPRESSFSGDLLETNALLNKLHMKLDDIQKHMLGEHSFNEENKDSSIHSAPDCMQDNIYKNRVLLQWALDRVTYLGRCMGACGIVD